MVVGAFSLPPLLVVDWAFADVGGGGAHGEDIVRETTNCCYLLHVVDKYTAPSAADIRFILRTTTALLYSGSGQAISFFSV